MTDTVPAPSRLRLVPAPRIDGPYDDERLDPPLPLIDGSLALAFPPPVRAGVPLRLVPPADATPVDRPLIEALPDPRAWSARLSQAIAEVLAGARAPQQLAEVASLDVLQLLERSAGRLQARQGRPASRPRVASVHVCEPTGGVVEVSAVIDTGPRRRALALRIEAQHGRWRCTAVHVG